MAARLPPRRYCRSSVNATNPTRASAFSCPLVPRVRCPSCICLRAFSSVGRATPRHGVGRWFKSSKAHGSPHTSQVEAGCSCSRPNPTPSCAPFPRGQPYLSRPRSGGGRAPLDKMANGRVRRDGHGWKVSHPVRVFFMLTLLTLCVSLVLSGGNRACETSS